MILFDYPEQISDLKKYKKLGFKISLDDPYNEIYYVEFDISEDLTHHNYNQSRAYPIIGITIPIGQ